MRRALALASALALSGCAAFPRKAALEDRPPTVVFLSDFGTSDDSVAVCKGVMWQAVPGLRVVDLTHTSPPFDVRAAGRLIRGASEAYPAGTVFVAVVDPGVGTQRKALALRTKAGRLYVGPDNGLFSQVIEAEGLAEAREIANPAYVRAQVSDTFHGRDLFSPAAAHLAAGLPLEKIGPRVEAPVFVPSPKPIIDGGSVRGTVDFIERPYGNVITDVPAALVREAGLRAGDDLEVALGTQTLKLPYLRTFGDVAEGQPLALPSSRGKLSFSINMGDFAAHYGIAPGQAVSVRRSP